MRYKIYEDSYGFIIRDRDNNYMFETDTRERANKIIEALEKQAPKDVQKKVDGWKIDCFCPSCTLEVFGRQSYCAVCGQYLKWN